MRIVARSALRVRMRTSRALRLLLQRGTPPSPSCAEPPRNLLADGVDGLSDVIGPGRRCQFLAPDPRISPCAAERDRALPEDLAGDDPPGRHRDQLEHGESRDGLATTGFADDAEGFARLRQDRRHRRHAHAVVRGKMRLQTAYFEQMLHITSLAGIERVAQSVAMKLMTAPRKRLRRRRTGQCGRYLVILGVEHDAAPGRNIRRKARPRNDRVDSKRIATATSIVRRR